MVKIINHLGFICVNLCESVAKIFLFSLMFVDFYQNS